MGITDKITGRAKKAVGDLTGDADTKRQGTEEEKKAQEKDKLARTQEREEAQAQKVDDLENRT